MPRSIRFQRLPSRTVTAPVLSRGILQGIHLRLVVYRSRAFRIHGLLSHPMRPGGLCQLDRLESPAAVKVYRQRELYATLERPEFLELNEGYIALRAIQYTDPDGDWAV